MTTLLDILKDKFKDIKDKGTLTPYYWHLVRCAIRLGPNASKQELLVALFHDILEDTNTTEQDLLNWSIPQDVVNAIKLCSNIYYKNITHKQWMEVVRDSGDVLAIKAKLVDLADNKSYERMSGLELVMKQQVSQKTKKVKPDIVMKNVRHFINKKCYGLGVRFFEDLQIILEKESNHFMQLNLDSFGSFWEYEQLYLYLKEDFKCYASKNNVKSFKANCELKVLEDKNGQPYLAAVVQESIASIYKNTLSSIVEDSDLLIANQQSRDKGKSHITVLNVMEYTALQKNKEYKDILDNALGGMDFVFSSIGSISRQSQQTYYALCESGYVQQLRANVGLKAKDLHMTLGFNEKDLFHTVKDRKTKICEFDIVWDKMYEAFSKVELKNKIIRMP